MKRAVIYARVSKEREESASIESQIEQCALRAKQLGASVVKVFLDEGIGGRDARNRREFLKAKAYCEAANVDYFITWSTSRFARNMLELFRSDDELKEVGTRLECLNADIDDETDTGFINKTIHGLIDEMKSRNIAKDTLRSQKALAAAGYFTGGHLPFGYRKVKDGAHNRLEPDPVQAPIVEEIFRLCLAGSGAQAIATVLNERQLLRSGKRWTKNGVAYILKNETYRAMRIFNKQRRRTRQVKPADEWVRVKSHPPLVTDDDFERVQAMLHERAPHHEHGGGHRSTFLFTGLAQCGICSARLQIRTGKGRGGTVYSYYACQAHKHGAARCLLKSLRADLFDDWLLGEILQFVVTPAAMIDAMSELLQAGQAWARQRERRRGELVTAMRELETRRGKLFELLEASGKDTPDIGLVAQRLRARTAELEQLQADLVALEATPAPGRPGAIDPETAAEVMRDVITRADAKKKRAFLGAFIERITASADGVTVDYRPEALVDLGSGVRSRCSWLPVAGLLRTKTVHFGRPDLRRRVARSRA